MTRRIVAAVLLLLTVAAGIGIHYGMPQSTFSDVAADAPYTVAAYLFIMVLAPRRRPWLVGAVAAAWCVAVELFQLTGIPLALGATFPPAMLVLGTVFSPRDLLVYAATAAILTIIDTLLLRSIQARREARRPLSAGR